jgi:hypothetical protein
MYGRSARVLVGAIVLLGVASTAEKRQALAQAGASARRYIDPFEFDRQREDLVGDQFRLLAQRAVRAELKLSSNQVVAVEKAWHTPHKELPGVAEFIARQKEKLADPHVTEQEHKALGDELARGCVSLRSGFLQQKLREILELKQRQRLDEILLQMRGPILIAVDPRLVARLEIRSDQMAAIKGVISETDKQIIPSLAKFGRGFISGLRTNESEQDRDREMRELIDRLGGLIKDRDDRILQRLTEEQAKRMKALQGAPIRIQWDPWEFLLEPFEKKGR